jgi:hypothetical protein
MEYIYLELTLEVGLISAWLDFIVKLLLLYVVLSGEAYLNILINHQSILH